MIDIAPIIGHLSERRAFMLGEAIERLEKAIASKAVKNVDFVQFKEVINLAVDEVFESVNDSIGNWDFHTLVMGAWNIPAALSEARKSGVAARVDVLTAMLPLRELLQAAKPLIVKRERKEAARPSLPVGHMTCQVCGRAIGAMTGVIAHHGYR
ncbi:hypothetical protein K2Y11_24585, partial [bacterium]|nr:hypothetical protein [bacterium]